MAPNSDFNFKAYAKFSEQDLKDRLALAAKQLNSNPSQVEKDMASFRELKLKYGIM